MPIYEYKCKTCGKEFDFSQRITEPALTKCPKEICGEIVRGKGEVERKISKNIGLVFNGSGFYLTDYVHKKNSLSSATTHHSSESVKVVEQKKTPSNAPERKDDSIKKSA